MLMAALSAHGGLSDSVPRSTEKSGELRLCGGLPDPKPNVANDKMKRDIAPGLPGGLRRGFGGAARRSALPPRTASISSLSGDSCREQRPQPVRSSFVSRP